MKRALKLKVAGAAAGFALTLLTLGIARSQNPDANVPGEQVVQVTAQRFHYSPNVIELKANTPARLEFTALDFTHGFSVPDLDIRADLPQGKVTVIHLKPLKPGVYEFLCDNFCGSGHEEMGAKIVVKDPA
jgi:cytochrome c oxidase subunit 2